MYHNVAANMRNADAPCKKYGYHRLLLPSQETIQGPVVVTLDAHSCLVEWHIMQAEEPMVEWIGGTFLAQIAENA